jgi:hypothetical protein
MQAKIHAIKQQLKKDDNPKKKRISIVELDHPTEERAIA